MPYEIRKKDKKYCVYKKEGGKTLGCHDTRADAVDQIQAIGAAKYGKYADSSWGAQYDRKAQLGANVEEFALGNPEALISYWRDGEGADRIDWGTACDFTRCMLLVGKYIPDDAGGFCQNRHMEIYGESNYARDKRLNRDDDCSGVTRPE